MSPYTGKFEKEKETDPFGKIPETISLLICFIIEPPAISIGFAVGKIDMVIGQILTTVVEPMTNEWSTRIVSSVRIALIAHWSLVPC